MVAGVSVRSLSGSKSVQELTNLRQNYLDSDVRVRRTGTSQDNRRGLRRAVYVGIEQNHDTAAITRASRRQLNVSLQLSLLQEAIAPHANRPRDVQQDQRGHLRTDSSDQHGDGLHLAVAFDNRDDSRQQSLLVAEEIQLPG